MSRVRIIILVLSVAAIIFVYGFLVGYAKIFPYQMLALVKNSVAEVLETRVVDAQNQQTFNARYRDTIEKLAADKVPDDSRTGGAGRKYTFFVAGHTYGNPKNPVRGLYPPFKQQFAEMNRAEGLAFGVLTGDLVERPSRIAWDWVVADLEALSVKIHISPGNHDLGIGPHTASRDIYEERFGNTYYAFNYQGDLFIVLDPNIAHWNIVGEQMAFLRDQILTRHEKGRNIFIFSHQLIWWDSENAKFSKIKLNSQQGRAAEVNFWSEVFPVIEQSKANVYLLAGDVGAFPNGYELFYTRIGKVAFIASGMGGGSRDNYLMVTVDQGQVGIKVVDISPSPK